jgi:hypothetical protein
MAIFTISSNTNYSAIKGSLANGDTIRIDTNTVRLTVDEAPLLTNITVDSPGRSGRMTVNGAYDMSTWSIIAGTVALIDGTFPAGATLGSATGGTGSGSSGMSINEGNVITASGGSANNAHGISTNNGSVTTVNGGASNGANGVFTNNGSVVTATGGSTNLAHAIFTNNGSVAVANGSSASNANGVLANNGSVAVANGGVGIDAFGVGTNIGACLQAFDNIGRAINISRGDFKLVDGPNFRTTINQTRDTITTIYTINGPLHPSAVIPVGVTVIELTTGGGGGGAAFQLVGGGGLVY